MLSTFDLNHIKNALDLAEQGTISPEARSRIAYCRKLIAHAEDKAVIAHASAYARANGSQQITSASHARRYLDGIAADCAAHGTN